MQEQSIFDTFKGPILTAFSLQNNGNILHRHLSSEAFKAFHKLNSKGSKM